LEDLADRQTIHKKSKLRIIMSSHAIAHRIPFAGKISSQKKSEFLLASVIIARSTSLIFSKMAMGSFEPFNLLALRFVTAFTLLGIVFCRKLAHIKPKELLFGGILGTMFTALLSLELYGLRLTDSGTTSFIENSAMIFVPVLQLAFFRKKPAKTDCIRIIIALTGLAVLTLAGSGGLLRPGTLYLLGAAFVYASAIMATAVFSRKCDPLMIGIVQVGTVGVLSLILSAFAETPHLPSTGSEWGMILALAIVCSGFGFTLQPVAQRGTTAERAGMMCAISPMSAAMLGIIFLGEQVSAAKATGCALIMISLIAEPLFKRLAYKTS